MCGFTGMLSRVEWSQDMQMVWDAFAQVLSRNCYNTQNMLSTVSLLVAPNDHSKIFGSSRLRGHCSLKKTLVFLNAFCDALSTSIKISVPCVVLKWRQKSHSQILQNKNKYYCTDKLSKV